MKLSLDATPQELRERGVDLLDALAKAVREHAPELAESLHKALPPKEQELKHKSLRQAHDKTRKRYGRMLERMNAEIASLLEGELRKAEADHADYTAKVVAMDEHALEQVKPHLFSAGYTEADFEEGGPLYGLSVNQLREVIKQKRGKA